MAVQEATKVSVAVDSLRNLTRLSGEILAESKRSKIVPPKTRKKIVELDHCAIMALNHLRDL
jgi:hypothetical protein